MKKTKKCRFSAKRTLEMGDGSFGLSSAAEDTSAGSVMEDSGFDPSA